MISAAFAQENLVGSDVDLRVDHGLADRADRFRVLDEDLVAFAFGWGFRGLGRLGFGHRPESSQCVGGAVPG
ncbi:hypothetical protein, partial [Glycomyces salinus]|uniref:hypothetical protein n=1 Tax=Glycomyces salinus TaxID=980294 RepID=UPI001E49A1A4